MSTDTTDSRRKRKRAADDDLDRNKSEAEAAADVPEDEMIDVGDSKASRLQLEAGTARPIVQPAPVHYSGVPLKPEDIKIGCYVDVLLEDTESKEGAVWSSAVVAGIVKTTGELRLHNVERGVSKVLILPPNSKRLAPYQMYFGGGHANYAAETKQSVNTAAASSSSSSSSSGDSAKTPFVLHAQDSALETSSAAVDRMTDDVDES